MPIYSKDVSRTVRCGFGYGTLCGNTFVIRPEHVDCFNLISNSVPSSQTYKNKYGVQITRLLEGGNGILTPDGSSFIILKRKLDGRDYLSTILKKEFSRVYLTPV